MAQKLALWSLVTLGAMIAFDLDYVVFEVGTIKARPHHALAVLAAGSASAYGYGLFTQRSFTRAELLVLRLLVIGLGTMLLAANMSPYGAILNQRTADFSLVFLVAAATIVVASRHRRAVVVSLGIGVSLAAVVGLVEFATSSGFLIGDRYRGQVTLLGDQERLTRPFSHSNIAAMFLGPTTVAVLAIGTTIGGRWKAAVIGAGVVLAAMTTATASRAGVATMIGGSIVLALARRRRALVAVAAVAFGMLAVLPWSQAVRDRVGGSDRFEATIVAPPALVLDDDKTISIFVRNDSSDAWDATGANAVALTARWRNGDQDRQWLTQVWPLPTPLGQGQSADVSVQMPIQVPDGNYVVLWDLLLDREAFFLESHGRQTLTSAVVVNSTADLASGPVALVREKPSRTQIWRWSVRLFAAHPWTGHGVAMSQIAVNELVDGATVSVSHAHNIVLEPLSSSGLVGSAVFISLVAMLVFDVGRRIRLVGPVGLAIGLALIVMLGHGLVEWPLMFPPLATLFAMTGGLWVGLREEVSTP